MGTNNEGRNTCDACAGVIEGAYSMRAGFQFCEKCLVSEPLAIRVAQKKHIEILKSMEK